MTISLTGLPGSGKTTIARLLAQRLNIPWYSMGDLRGQMAIARGMTIDELNKLGETKKFTDQEVDDYQTQLGRSGESFIIDGRLSWHFLPQSFKIFLEVSPNEGAQRIYTASQKRQRDDEPAYASVAEAKLAVSQRLASDQLRYQKYYNLDFMKRDNFDLVVDTTKLLPEEVLTRILDALPQVK